jgi:hypothetical protein
VRSARAELLDDPHGHGDRFAIPQDHAIAAAGHLYLKAVT